MIKLRQYTIPRLYRTMSENTIFPLKREIRLQINQNGKESATTLVPDPLSTLVGPRSRAVRKAKARDYSLGSLRRHFLPFASNAVSQHRRSAQALLTLCSGCSVTFLLSLSVTHPNLLTIRFYRAKVVNSTRPCSGVPTRLLRSPNSPLSARITH